MSSEAKHTPGPRHRNIPPASKYPIIFAGRNTHIAEIKSSGLPASEVESNADLIAAAPELYEIATLFEKSIAYEISRSRGDGDDEGAHMKLITLNMVRDVLVKATGVQK